MKDLLLLEPENRSARKATAVAYDFRRPIQLSKENSRVLQISLENFARTATTAFTNTMRTLVTVSLAKVEQRSYTEYVEVMPQETFMVLLDTDPVPGSGVMQMPLDSVMLCLDIMMGGPGAEKQPMRSLTEIERTVFALLIEDRLLQGLRDALAPVAPLSLGITSIEFSPQFALASSTSDVMIVASFDVGFRNTTTTLTVALPFSGLNPYLVRAAKGGSLSRAEQEKRAVFTAGMAAAMKGVPVTAAVSTRPFPIAPALVSALAVGDVIALGHPAAAPFDVTVDGTTLAHASVGRRGKKIAAQVKSVKTPTLAASDNGQEAN